MVTNKNGACAVTVTVEEFRNFRRATPIFSHPKILKNLEDRAACSTKNGGIGHIQETPIFHLTFSYFSCDPLGINEPSEKLRISVFTFEIIRMG